jgi:hypothetical protein
METEPQDPFPGRSAARSGALQTRDRNELRVREGPGSAVHRSTLHRIRETQIGSAPSARTAEKLTIPYKRPIKPVYIRKLVAFIDAVKKQP